MRARRVDVAKLAGVAPSTVSLALNGRAAQVQLAPETVRRIQRAARQLHYVPNASARALRRRGPRTIGLMPPPYTEDPRIPKFADVVTATVQRAKQLGYFVLVLPSVTEDPDEMLSAMRDADIVGVVCHGGELGQRFGTEMSSAGLPVVWISHDGPPESRRGGRSIEIDIRPGIEELGAHLWTTGYRSLGVVVGMDRPVYPSSRRYRGLARRFAGRVTAVHAKSWSSEAGRLAMHEIIDQKNRPDAVFAGNDVLAAGALHACREAGLQVPGDIAVAGFGGFEISSDLTPTLTTVLWPLDELASGAVSLLSEVLDGSATGSRREVLRTKLIIREST